MHFMDILHLGSGSLHVQESFEIMNQFFEQKLNKGSE